MRALLGRYAVGQPLLVAATASRQLHPHYPRFPARRQSMAPKPSAAAAAQQQRKRRLERELETSSSDEEGPVTAVQRPPAAAARAPASTGGGGARAGKLTQARLQMNQVGRLRGGYGRSRGIPSPWRAPLCYTGLFFAAQFGTQPSL